METQNAKKSKMTTVAIDWEVHQAIVDEKIIKDEKLNSVLRRKYGMGVE